MDEVLPMRNSHVRMARLTISQLEERTTPVFAKWPFAGGPAVDPIIGVYGQYQDLKDYGTLGDVTTATGYDTFVHFDLFHPKWHKSGRLN
jgi:hypothetical protein